MMKHQIDIYYKQTTVFIQFFILIFALGMITISCEGPEGPVGPEGPQGEQGEQGPEGPQGPAGEDGNANVSLYIFDGHDFSENFRAQGCISGVSEDEMHESVWLYYLVTSSEIVYNVPGTGSLGQSQYRAYVQWATATCDEEVLWRVDLSEGTGEPYEEIRIVRIEATEIIFGKRAEQGIVPNYLDTSDYHAVMEYYGLDPKL